VAHMQTEPEGHYVVGLTAGSIRTKRGYPIVQSGRWGEPGSGRFAHAEATSIGGVTVELLGTEQ
jgi:hypothetical protein